MTPPGEKMEEQRYKDLNIDGLKGFRKSTGTVCSILDEARKVGTTL
jgi:hypothetical protein